MQESDYFTTYYDIYYSDGTREWRGGGARSEEDAVRAAEQMLERHPHYTYTIRKVDETEQQ